MSTHVPASQPALEVRLPGIVIAPAAGEVRIDGQTCMQQGIVEYIGVASGGKAYESLFLLNCRPSHVQAALLIAGYQQGELPPQLRGDSAPTTRATSRPAGRARLPALATMPATGPALEPTRVTIDVDLKQEDDSWQRQPIESFLIDRRTGSRPTRLAWAFTGSFFFRDRRSRLEYFAAEAERSLIALWYDPTALLNLAQDVGNPYRGAASGVAVNPAAMPKPGTPVRLVLRPVPVQAESRE